MIPRCNLGNSRPVRTVQKPERNFKRRPYDAAGLLLCGLVVICFASPFTAPFIGIWHSIDPFNLVLEDFILPSAYNRGVSLILGSYLLRFTLCITCVLEFTRFASIILCGMFVWLLGSLSNLHKLHVLVDTEGYPIYRKLRIALAHGNDFVNYSAGVFIFAGHISLVLLVWLLVACFSILSIEIYVMTFVITVAISSLLLVLFNISRSDPIFVPSLHSNPANGI